MLQSLPLLKALADETRLRLCHVLLHHELNVGELVEVFGMGQSRVSRHLKILSDCGLLQYRRDGLWVFYAVPPHGAGRGLLEAALALAEQAPQLQADLQRAEAVLAERRLATRRFFDAVAGDWGSLRTDVLGEFDLQGAITQRLPQCRTVLDLGCGGGELLLALADKAGTVIGVDSSPRMIEQARRRLASKGGEVSLRIGELEHLPVRDGEADCGVISMALHHLADPRAGIAEAYRVLRDNGRLIIAELDKHDDETMRRSHQDRWLGFSARQLEAWLQEAGFIPGRSTRHQVNRRLAVLLVEAQKQANIPEEYTT